MVNKNDIVEYLNSLLSIHEFNNMDFCTNGLQVDGAAKVSSITTSVSVTDKVLREMNDNTLLLSHHGLFWNSDKAPMVGHKGRKVKLILEKESSLASYHLPLDAEGYFGNNVSLVNSILRCINKDRHTPYFKVNRFEGISYSLSCDGDSNIDSRKIMSILQSIYKENKINNILNIGCDANSIRNIFLCTGAGQSLLEKAINQGADCFISGEGGLISEMIAKDASIPYFVCGHHNTEVAGIKNLGKITADEFNIEHKHIYDGTIS